MNRTTEPPQNALTDATADLNPGEYVGAIIVIGLADSILVEHATQRIIQEVKEFGPHDVFDSAFEAYTPGRYTVIFDDDGGVFINATRAIPAPRETNASGIERHETDDPDPAGMQLVGTIDWSDFIQIDDSEPMPRRKALTEAHTGAIHDLPVGTKLYACVPGTTQQPEQPGHLPPFDPDTPREAQGLHQKYIVRRVDGTDEPGGKHHDCRLFVLDADHDPYAVKALGVYASACEAQYPVLAKDLVERFGALKPASNEVAKTTGRHHDLKTDPALFEPSHAGRRPWEIRLNDRDFQAGDTVTLHETVATGAEMAKGAPLEYTGRTVTGTITFVQPGPIYGLADRWCIFSVQPTPADNHGANSATGFELGMLYKQMITGGSCYDGRDVQRILTMPEFQAIGANPSAIDPMAGQGAAICQGKAELLRALTAAKVPDGVWEALQRLIENGETLGPASGEDSLLVARYYRHLVTPIPKTPASQGYPD
ncbi:MAG: hypothetical protein AWU57_626 [Marinobacter sp. T13-3]|nr:MAG: hypothetical protein AWU57_626 [Marinobacter sp. T13-3]